jgi:hypothetical protein
MSISETVDAEYRIHPPDLPQEQSEWIVRNVSYQGLENIAPVLHLDGMVKRLVLDPAQSRQMMTLTRSSIPEEWIGARIRLGVTTVADDKTIAITGADIPTPRRQWPSPIPPQLESVTARFVLIAMCSAIVFALAWLAFLARFAP